jgi:spermidine dehydrogenase
MNSRATISFPGGNTTFARHLVRSLIPDSMDGALNFDDVLNKPVHFAALDRKDAPTRIRLNSTVIRVEHEGSGVAVIYEKEGKLYRTRARAAVVASAGWVNRHTIADLPANIRSAYDDFQYAPAMSVNVALTNWRFLYKLDAPAVRYFGGDFGWSCNIRQNMVTGPYHPPLHPDQPTVLTFYLGLYTPGRPAGEQGNLGRTRMLATSYADYERQIRSQMTTLFAGAGFDARKDIAGIILNRWGHARVMQPPGFYYGRDGKPAAREIVQKGFGRIAIAHAELNGHQNATGALAQGRRAAEQVMNL